MWPPGRCVIKIKRKRRFVMRTSPYFKCEEFVIVKIPRIYTSIYRPTMDNIVLIPPVRTLKRWGHV